MLNSGPGCADVGAGSHLDTEFLATHRFVIQDVPNSPLPAGGAGV